MGYTTDFFGEFTITPTLKKEHADYLRMFAETRRVKRSPELTEKRPDPLREAVGLPVGVEGGYFVGATERGEDAEVRRIRARLAAKHDAMPIDFFEEAYLELGVLDPNREPEDQPGLWCQWTPNEDGTAMRWDGGEKFYSYVEWLQYLVEHFLGPWGYRLNGSVRWQGEEHHDKGRIVVADNEISTRKATQEEFDDEYIKGIQIRIDQGLTDEQIQSALFAADPFWSENGEAFEVRLIQIIRKLLTT